MKASLKAVFSSKYLPLIAAAAGGLFFIMRLVYYSHHHISMIDEGSYVYKGFLFVTGAYKPFEPYGTYTNHMPFSFLIPGAVQALFGPGVRAARYFVIVMGCLSLLLVWLTARRLANDWFAALAVWAVAANLSLIIPQSFEIARGLSAALIMLAIWLTAGPGRKDWQIVLGALAAVVVVFTRINLAPFLPVMIVYIYWQHGWKSGHKALGAAVLLAGAVTLWLSPDIFRFWPIRRGLVAVGLRSLVPQVPAPSPSAVPVEPFAPVFKRAPEARQQVLSTMEGMQVHFISFTSILLLVLGIPALVKQRKQPYFKALVMLAGVFLSLLGFSLYGTVMGGYCVYCFRPYLSFFMPVGIVLMAVLGYAFYSREEKMNRVWLGILAVLPFPLLGYVSSYKIGKEVAALEIPWPGGGGIQRIELWAPFANKFGLPYETLVWLLPVGMGLVLGLALLALNNWGLGRLLRESIQPGQTFAAVVFAALVGLSGSRFVYDPVDQDLICDANIIRLYEDFGAQLSAELPSGAKVFWHGGNATILFTEFPQVELFPPLINMYSSFGFGGNADELLRKGYWNVEVAEEWLAEADYLIVYENYREVGFISDLLVEEIDSGRYLLRLTTPVMADCKLDQGLILYERVGE